MKEGDLWEDEEEGNSIRKERKARIEKMINNIRTRMDATPTYESRYRSAERETAKPIDKTDMILKVNTNLQQ